MIIDKLKPRAIIFDLGSTLIEYEAVPWDELGVECSEAGWRFLRKTHPDIPEFEAYHLLFLELRDEYRRVASDSLVEWDVPTVAGKLFERLQLGGDDQLVDRFFDAYYEPVDARLYIYDDTLDTLERLHSSYPTMGLVSNTVFPERAHRHELQRFGLEPYLKFALFSSTFGLRKPHRDIFIQAANQAGYSPRECVYIGDRYIEDIVGPKSIGMEAILKVKPGREYPDSMPDLDRQVLTLAELTDHIIL